MNIVKKVYVTLRGVACHPLRRKTKLRTCFDYVVAQVASRLVPGDLSVAFPNETRLLISPHMKGAAHFIIPGLCEFEEMAFAMHFLRPEDLFVDVGANIGAYTVLASGVSGCRTVAFEPGALAFRYLRQNVRLNDLQAKVTLRNEAVGSRQGMISMTDDLGTENFVCPGLAPSGAPEVPVTTLDRALAGAIPALIKVDVEGFETEVFGGAPQTIAHGGVAAMIVERLENAKRYGYDEAALHRRIQDLGFAPCAYAPFSRALRPLPPEAEGNLIYVRDVAATQQRLEQAEAFQFDGRRI